MEFLKKVKFGYSIDYKNIKDIIKKIKLIKENYNIISKNACSNSKWFNWDEVSKKFKDLY